MAFLWRAWIRLDGQGQYPPVTMPWHNWWCGRWRQCLPHAPALGERQHGMGSSQPKGRIAQHIHPGSEGKGRGGVTRRGKQFPTPDEEDMHTNGSQVVDASAWNIWERHLRREFARSCRAKKGVDVACGDLLAHSCTALHGQCATTLSVVTSN